MQEPIEAYCHVGVIHPMAFPEVLRGEGPVLETLEQILADDFFSAVEVSWIKDEGVRRQAGELLASSGVDVVFAGQPPLLTQSLSLNAPEAAARRRAVEECKRAAGQAYELGARIMPVLSGPDPGEGERGQATQLLIESLKELCAYAQEQAEDQMLAISLENFDRMVDKKCLIGPTKEAAVVAEAVKSEYSNFGLTIDLSHQPLLGESAHDMAIYSIDHLIHVHVGNCVLADRAHPAYGDNHPRFGVAGGEIGVQELRRFLEVLIYVGYFKKNTPTTRPVVSFEVKPLAGESSTLLLANAKRALRQAWAEL